MGLLPRVRRVAEDPSVTRSDWLPWLREQQWYHPAQGIGEQYPAIIEHMLLPRSERRRFFTAVLRTALPPSVGYQSLARLAGKGWIRTILTTNFDDLVPRSLKAEASVVGVDEVSGAAEAHLVSTAPPYPQVVFLHGRVEQYTDANLETETQRIDPALRDALVPLVRDHPLVVIGYRGAEPSIMVDLLGNADSPLHFPHGIYWCVRGNELPNPLVQALADRLGGNFQLVRIDGFDQALTAWDDAARPAAIRLADSAASKVQELRAVEGSTPEVLDWPLVQDSLAEYAERLDWPVPENPGRTWYLARLAELGMVTATPAHTPTRAGLLLFGRDPQDVKTKAGTYELRPGTGGGTTEHPRLTASDDAKAAGQYSLFDLDEPGETLEDRALPDPADLIRRDLRRALKAAAMPHRIPIQLLAPALFTEGTRGQQDPAARAWNLAVALFYKAGGLPWRFQPQHEHTCYVGISFHHLRTSARHLVYASLAQAFSSHGDGFALRGAAMPWTERDTDLHLDHDGMFDLLTQVLAAYRERTGRYPLRVVVHKSTRFHDDERDGAHRALGDIPLVELMTLGSGDFRVLRQGSYPPHRGSLACVGPATFLFTAGYVPELGTYPGPHIPVPIEIIPVGNLDTHQAAQDLLALTKLNWNNANPCAAFPITLSFARQVGSIMAEVPDGQVPHPAYRFYM